jgi:phage FluMu gp28-like protein
VFRNRTVRLYRDEALLRDLMRLTIVERANGSFRLQTMRDEHGHADRAIALAMALPTATQLAKHLLWSWHNEAADEERFLAAERGGFW